MTLNLSRRALQCAGFHGRVPKWTKGTDCKSVIRGFESHLGLFAFGLASRLSPSMDATVLSIRISFVPAYGDYRRFVFWAVFRRLRISLFVVVAALALLIGVTAFRVYKEGAAIDRSTILIVAWVALVLVIIPFSYLRTARKRWLKSLELRLPRTYVFSDAGIESSTVTSQARLTWAYIVKARKLKGLVMLGTGQQAYFLIPVAAFESPQSYEQFLVLVREKVADSHL